METTRFKVDGMDCASCAAKVETAARRVSGVSEVEVFVTAGTMSVKHAADADLQEVARKVTSLGYTASPLAARRGGQTDAKAKHEHHDHDHHDHDHDGHDGHDHSDHDHSKHDHAPSVEESIGLHGHDHGPTDGPWWNSAKARLTIASGLALGLAFVLSWLAPSDQPMGVHTCRRHRADPDCAPRLDGGAERHALHHRDADDRGGGWRSDHQRVGRSRRCVFLFLVGELLEGIAAGRARASIQALATLVPKTALLERDGATAEVEAESLSVGDVILVRPGDRIPADGAILSGDTAIDESPINGESVPKAKGAGDQVFAGTINQSGVIRVTVSAAAQDNTISRIIQLVEEAQESKAPTERFIDRFSRYYTPGVMVVAALIAILPPLLAGGDWNEWIYKGLAVLLIGCPCALVISTPAAIAAALSAGARRGLLMKGGAVLETLGKVTKVAFDKTGTLTEGKPKVTDLIAVGREEVEILQFAAALETGSSHPLAVAILDEAKARGVIARTATRSRAIGGEGVEGVVGAKTVFLGSPKAAAVRVAFSAELDAQIVQMNDDGKTVSVLLVEQTIAGLIAMRDEPRDDAKAGIAALSDLGISAIMLTGDNARTAKAIAQNLGIEPRAELMPQDKQRIVGELRAAGEIVAKVGDGINDAPALAAADVGIAMGGGTDVALETADAAILHGRVMDVAGMVKLSRATMANIWQNITIALGLKAVFLVTTVLGITGLWPAILADTGATVLVTANAMRLLAWKPR
jgi:Cd2+/Zn2+-exporting ATPase